MFGGETYNARLDRDRLLIQLRAVYDLMSDGHWRTLAEISQHVGAPEASVSARLRDFRKKKHGGLCMLARRIPGTNGLWRYKLWLEDAADNADEENDMGKKENELSTNDEVRTPSSIYQPIIDALGPIGFDPCSHPAASVPASTIVLLPKYWTAPEPCPAEQQCGEQLVLWGSGLDFHWGDMGLVFVNPPYSNLTREHWIQKARDEADEAVLFLPVRTAGAWWQDEVTTCQAITFLRGRVTHDGETVGAPFHQALVYCGPNVEHWVRVISPLGWTVVTGAKHHRDVKP